MRVDLFTYHPACYSFENYAMRHFRRELDKLKVPHSTQCLAEGTLTHYLAHVQKDPPAWTFSFEPLTIHDHLLCEALNVPHLHWNMQSIGAGLPYLLAPLGLVAFQEMASCEKLHERGFSNAHFLSYPVDPEEREDPARARPFDVVIFSPLVDIHHLEIVWKDLFSPSERVLLHGIIEKCEENPSLLPFEVTWQTYVENSLSVNLREMILAVEEYLKAKRNVKLIESLENVRVDVFGRHMGNNWLKRLKNRENIYLHLSLPFTEYFEVLKRSKILVHDQLDVYNGSDRWFFLAFMAGALVVTNGSPYLKENVGKEAPFFYGTQNGEEMNSKVKYFLSHPQERSEWVLSIQDKIVLEHAWEKKVKDVLDIM